MVLVLSLRMRLSSLSGWAVASPQLLRSSLYVSDSCLSELSARTIEATMAVVSSALFAGTSASCELQGARAAGSDASNFTRRMARDTSAAAACRSCAASGSASISASGSMKDGMSSRPACSGRRWMPHGPPAAAARGWEQCDSSVRLMSSSPRLSNRPSVPSTTRSPCRTGVEPMVAPWITACACEPLRPWRRCTWTGRRAS
mmetsp:Transcript_89692/g.254309  ORF Transcript_89692/g.254309 Transcript_89692/m.254309 type:complete len:202 (-) Transcript_89692:1346-1951(-)